MKHNLSGKMSAVIVAYLISVGSVNASSLSDITSQADAIVVGSVNTRTETKDKVTFDLSVDRVLKGEHIPPSLVIDHAWVRKSRMYDTPNQIDTHLYGIWFLKKATGAGWDLITLPGIDGIVASLYLPAVEQVSEATQHKSLATPEDQVVLELSAALRMNKTSPETLLNIAGPLDSPAMQTAISDFLHMTEPSFKTVGLALLLTQSKQEAVTRLTEIWPSIHETKNSSLVTWALRNSFRDSTPDSVIGLVQLANEPSGSDLRSHRLDLEGFTYKGFASVSC